MRIRDFVILAVLLSAGAAPSTLPSKGGEDLSQLIAQLDAPEFSVREAAEKKLWDSAGGAEPQLREALNHPLSDEARARISEILNRLDQERAIHAIITLHQHDAPMMRVLKDFAAQSGGDMGINQQWLIDYAKNRTASIDLAGANYWDSLKALCQATHLQPWLGIDGLSLAPPDRTLLQIDFSNPYQTTAGGLLVVAQTSQYLRTINYNTAARPPAMLTLSLLAIPEPKMHVVGASGIGWVKECVDDKGHSLLPVQGRHRPFFYPGPFRGVGARENFWNLSANLVPDHDLGGKIARLRGEVEFNVETKSEEFSFDDVTRSKGDTKGDGPLRVTLDDCTSSNNTYRFDVSLSGSPMIIGPSLQEFMSTVRLLDDQGNSIPRLSVTPMVYMANRGTKLALVFATGDRVPAKLVWQRTLEFKRMTVPFELHDLPLY